MMDNKYYYIIGNDPITNTSWNYQEVLFNSKLPHRHNYFNKIRKKGYKSFFEAIKKANVLNDEIEILELNYTYYISNEPI